ncbi:MULTISPECIES: hypothetical protein [Gammaproteobacteria]|uniref:DUF4156 domain-containing protein n=1 Tax=Vreelandella halophila TaxID=86177 RepID=A0A9X4Y8D1_9GAMM|nr:MULTISPECIES: hypothetical protein [Gammaproteobacteria]KAA8979304.1 hypothetical protein F3089_13030 [Halospina sp. K52047b]MYL25251.1 hypothetical protein [Halomonas utahensis]MYL75313.1 hypothetical protein [Halomonas sp. 22501_18_FS]
MGIARQLTALVTATGMLAGCAANPSPEAARIVEAHPSEVEGCEPVGSVYGSSSGFHWSQGEAMAAARNHALESAARRDATHVVWQHDETSITPEVSGTAYRCAR